MVFACESLTSMYIAHINKFQSASSIMHVAAAGSFVILLTSGFVRYACLTFELAVRCPHACNG